MDVKIQISKLFNLLCIYKEGESYQIVSDGLSDFLGDVK
jgi:hypothetical protein